MSSAAPKEILLVEDDPDHAELTRRALGKGNERHNVVWVKDGQEALDFVRRQGAWAAYRGAMPSVIVLDVGLPKVAGHDVLSAIKRDERLRHIPVIMLTTSADPADVARCYDLGANSYVVKALNFGDFIARVRAIKDYWVNTNVFPGAFAFGTA
jgi:CheY-like chemotaxis protein